MLSTFIYKYNYLGSLNITKSSRSPRLALLPRHGQRLHRLLRLRVPQLLRIGAAPLDEEGPGRHLLPPVDGLEEQEGQVLRSLRGQSARVRRQAAHGRRLQGIRQRDVVEDHHLEKA